MNVPPDDRLIDRLIDGELPDGERRGLLLRLEAEPDGWRRCALAFLEAQGWRDTFVPLAASARGAAPAPPAADGPRRKRNPWRPAARLTALAAGLVAAFALGWALRGGPPEDAPRAPTARVEPPTPSAPADPPQPAPAAVVAQAAPPSAPPDPVVKQWEQRGYRAETQERVVSMELKDGRKLSLPVREVRLRYVGDRTY